MSDVGIISLFGMVIGILGTVIVISFRLGRYVSRVEKLETDTEHDRLAAIEDRREARDTMKSIFAKLEALSLAVPHRCDQTERLARFESRQESVFVRLESHESRMDRIQKEVLVIQESLVLPSKS